LRLQDRKGISVFVAAQPVDSADPQWFEQLPDITGEPTASCVLDVFSREVAFIK